MEGQREVDPMPKQVDVRTGNKILDPNREMKPTAPPPPPLFPVIEGAQPIVNGGSGAYSRDLLLMIATAADARHETTPAPKDGTPEGIEREMLMHLRGLLARHNLGGDPTFEVLQHLASAFSKVAAALRDRAFEKKRESSAGIKIIQGSRPADVEDATGQDIAPSSNLAQPVDLSLRKEGEFILDGNNGMISLSDGEIRSEIPYILESIKTEAKRAGEDSMLSLRRAFRTIKVMSTKGQEKGTSADIIGRSNAKVSALYALKDELNNERKLNKAK